MVRTFLTEATFGIAIIVGVALNDVILNLDAEWRKLSPKLVKAVLPILIISLSFGIFGFASKAKVKFDALCVLSASRQNFKDIINFISINLNDKKKYLVVIDYKDMGLSAYEDIRPINDIEKAHRQKTMSSDDLQMLLRIADKQSISVHDLKWFYESREVSRCFLLAMNTYEQLFVKGLNLKKDIIYKTKRCGERACLYYVVKQIEK